jgi:hypothetical protein
MVSSSIPFHVTPMDTAAKASSMLIHWSL